MTPHRSHRYGIMPHHVPLFVSLKEKVVLKEAVVAKVRVQAHFLGS